MAASVQFALERWRSWLFIAVLMTVGFYVVQLAMLIIRFMQWPNYINVYDWVGNLQLIAESTPSLADMLSIMKEEWWLEIGHMNHDYGFGISVWSLYIAPAKVVVVFLVSCLVAINALMLFSVKGCAMGRHGMATGVAARAGLANGLGATLFAVTSITMSWVVCCSTPTWIVGLAILGLGVTATSQVEVLGPWLTSAGLGLLLIGNVLLTRQLQRLPLAAHNGTPRSAAGKTLVTAR